jgi:hypothetical protein
MKITVYDRFLALKLEPHKQDMAEVGMIVSNLYQQIFREKPEKEEREVLSFNTVFNVYPADFSIIIDNCIYDYLKSDRRKYLLKKPERVAAYLKKCEERKKRQEQAKAFKERKRRKRMQTINRSSQKVDSRQKVERYK